MPGAVSVRPGARSRTRVTPTAPTTNHKGIDMTTPPPPPGSGGNPPFDPTGSNPYPSSGAGATPPNTPPPAGPPPAGPPSYGSGGGLPPQMPPPAMGGPTQGGSDQTKILSFVSMGTGIVGIILCCCWGVPIFSIAALVTGFIAKNQTKQNPRPDLKTFIMVGLITGAIGLVIAVVYWILYAAGAISMNGYSDF